MWVIMDIIIIAVILLCTFIGYKKGLVGVIFKIISFFIAILVAILLSGPISNWIMENTSVAQEIEGALTEKLIEENVEEKEIEKEDINNTSQIVVDYINKYTTDVKNVGVRATAREITATTIRVVVIIVLYIGTKIILFFFRALVNALAELPIIKQFNKLGGTIYGLLKGILIVYVVLALLSLIAPMVNNVALFEMINSSILGNFMYNHNLILTILF